MVLLYAFAVFFLMCFPVVAKMNCSQVFDPLNQGDKGTAKPLEKKTELSPEEKLREMEKEPCCMEAVPC